MVAVKQTNTAVNLLLSKANLYSNNLLISRSFKNSLITSKLLNKYQLFKNTSVFQQQTNARTNRLQATANLEKQLALVSESTNYEFFPLSLAKKQKSTIKKEQVSSIFTFLSAQTISYYICGLLKRDSKVKYGLDSSNLNRSVTLILKKLLTPFKEVVLGIKVVCSGK
jgi:hypothetical protein